MARKQNAQTAQPTAASSHEGAAPAPAKPTLSVVETAEAPAKGGTVNLWLANAANEGKTVARKVQLMTTVRQRLAEAADLFSQGGEFAAEATEIADNQAMSLYQGRTDGLLSPDEISGVLIDVFGAKPRKDGKPGKTPNGEGEAVRKRIVRAANAFEYVTNGDGGAFFVGLPENEVSDAVDALNSGSISIWRAYDRFAEIKKDHTERAELAFDPKRIGTIAHKLGQPGSADMLRKSPTLVAAYTALYDILTVIGTVEAPAKKAG